jgi:hypothetical protein
MEAVPAVSEVVSAPVAPAAPSKPKRVKTKPGQRTPKKKLKVPKPKNVPVGKVKGKKGGKVVERTRVARAVTPGKDGSRAWGPGTKAFKFKPLSLRGECDVLGCKGGAHKPTAFRCLKHKKEIRKEQLRANNQTWFKRIEKGTAKHHVVYTSPVTGKQELTEWALMNPDRAMAQVKKGISIVDAEQFKKLVAKSKEAAAKNKKGAKGRAK